MGTIVFFWVSGFDIIYALQDEDFDKSLRLKSMPALLGKARALRLSEGVHLIAAGLVIFLAWMTGGGILHWIGATLFILLLIYQHLIVKPDDLHRVNLAFFTTNGIASVAYAAFLIAGMLMG